LESCRNIVTAARKISEAIRTSIPELYVVGDPPASVVAFASKHPNVDVMEVGDVMNKRGWHLNALLDPKAVHIACTVSRFFIDVVEYADYFFFFPSNFPSVSLFRLLISSLLTSKTL